MQVICAFPFISRDIKENNKKKTTVRIELRNAVVKFSYVTKNLTNFSSVRIFFTKIRNQRRNMFHNLHDILNIVCRHHVLQYCVIWTVGHHFFFNNSSFCKVNQEFNLNAMKENQTSNLRIIAFFTKHFFIN